MGTLVYNDDENGNVVENGGSLPFGEQLACNPSVDYTETHYTDKKRDQESNLDYFGARYDSSTLGRFMSPDPSGLIFADPANPQSLNLYSYAQNNPLTNTDPTGLDCVYVNNDTGALQGFNRGDCNSSTEALANTGQYIDGHVDTLYSSDGTSQGTYGGYDATSDNGNALFGRNAQQPNDQSQQIDPDQARIAAVVQGIARDTAGFPTVCSVGAYVQAGVELAAGGYSYDSNKGGNLYTAFRATPGSPGSMPSITQGSIPLGDPSPFSATVKRNVNGTYSGGATIRDPATGVGGGVSVNEHGTSTVSASVQRGPVTAGLTATLGTIGNP